MKLFFTLVAIARNRVHTGLGLWVIFILSVAIYSVSADTIVLKSGETLKGQITSESDLSVTISTETSTGKTDKTIAKSEIVGMTLSSPPAAPTPSSVSPDKQWEYKCDEYGLGQCAPEIVKAGTTEVVLDLDQELGVSGPDAKQTEVIWARDSKRFACNYSPLHAHHTTYETVAFYQLRGDKWVALHSPVDKSERAQLIRLAKEHLPKSFNPRHCAPNRDVLKVRNWTDANTAILYAPCYGRTSGELEAGFLFTVKFDAADIGKIVKTHQMSKKELEEE
jgi:hypothetical protein